VREPETNDRRDRIDGLVDHLRGFSDLCVRPVFKRRYRVLITRQSSAATHKICSEVRRWDALANDMLTPLKNATHAATQMGHLGIKTRVMPGIIHPAISPPRRRRDAGGSALSPI
jgi:hypothetical protein